MTAAQRAAIRRDGFWHGNVSPTRPNKSAFVASCCRAEPPDDESAATSRTLPIKPLGCGERDPQGVPGSAPSGRTPCAQHQILLPSTQALSRAARKAGRSGRKTSASPPRCQAN